LFLSGEIAYKAIESLGEVFKNSEQQFADIIRRRLEALACHHDENMRVIAYRTLLLSDPNPTYSKSFPAFINSGLAFLNEDSIAKIAASNLGKKHLDSLRKRMFIYRQQFNWPVDENTRKQFISLLKLLFNYATHHLEYYSDIRAEFATWSLLSDDPQLSEFAKKYISDLDKIYDTDLLSRISFYAAASWEPYIMFESGISMSEKKNILYIISATHYIHKAVKLIFNDDNYYFSNIITRGFWVVKMNAYKEFIHYRLSINTLSGQHFDLHLVMSETFDSKANPETVFWHSAIAGHPFGDQVVPSLGCSSDEIGILITQYIGGLSVWDKIREFSEIHKSAAFVNQPESWRKMFIKSIKSYFVAWKNSGYRIVPGNVSPNNMVVPEMDFRNNALILTISGWKKYQNGLLIVEPVIKNYYSKTAALYPWTKKFLNIDWVFDSVYEGLTANEAASFLSQLLDELLKNDIFTFDNISVAQKLQTYIVEKSTFYYYPLAVYNAIHQFTEWLHLNPLATSKAKEQTIFEVMELFQIYNLESINRYFLYRNTYFEYCSDEVKACFDKLLKKMEENRTAIPIQLIELSDLQSVLNSDDDRLVFSKMVFPNIKAEQKLDIRKVVNRTNEQVVVHSELKDKYGNTFYFRRPMEPSEVGILYQLFFKENYPKEISEQDIHFVITDINNKIIGGLCYKVLELNTILLDGLVIASALQGRGLGSAMIEDFFTRMATHGVKVVKAHFLFGNYYLKHNFKVDKKWGALVRYI